MDFFNYGIIIAGLLIISFTLLRRISKRRDKQSKSEERRSSHTRSSSLTTRAENLILQLETISREINAQLDVKIKILEKLIDQADCKINDLNTAGVCPEKRTNNSPLNPSSTEERYKQIFDLADNGKTAAEICDQTGMLRGEVELIIGLRKSKQKGNENI